MPELKLVDGLDEPISHQEVSLAIKSLRLGKASGLDGVVSELIKFGGEKMENSLVLLFRLMFEIEQFPLDWIRGIIAPIHKDGDERVPENYRGITLLSIVGKLYSSILAKRISLWCEKNGKLSDEQCGFRPGRATIDQVFILSEILHHRKESKLDTVGVFLDIKKAYDTVPRNGI